MKRVGIILSLAVTFIILNSAYAHNFDNGIVNDPESKGAVLYEDRSKNSEQLGIYFNGLIVLVYEYDDDWAYVNAGPIYTPWLGYMSREQLIIYTALPEATIPIVQNDMKYISLIGDGDISLRSEPNTNSAVIGEYLNESIALVIGEAGDWYHIIIKDIPGFVQHNEVRFIAEIQYDQNGFPIIPTKGKVYLNPDYDEIPTYPFTIYDNVDIWTMDEILTYGMDRLDLIADLGKWYHVSINGYEYYIESQYFAERSP